MSDNDFSSFTSAPSRYRRPKQFGSTAVVVSVAFCMVCILIAGALCVGIWFFGEQTLYPERALVREHIHMHYANMSLSDWKTVTVKNGVKRVSVRAQWHALGTDFVAIQEYEVKNGKVTRLDRIDD